MQAAAAAEVSAYRKARSTCTSTEACTAKEEQLITAHVDGSHMNILVILCYSERQTPPDFRKALNQHLLLPSAEGQNAPKSSAII